jgi:hypothetical protein
MKDAADFSASNISINRRFTIWARYNAAGDTQFHFTIAPKANNLVTLGAMRVDVVDRDPFAELPLGVLSRQPLDDREDDMLQHAAFNIRAVLDDVTSVSPVPAELSDEALYSALLFGTEGQRNSGIMIDRVCAIGFRWMSWFAVYRDAVNCRALPLRGDLTVCWSENLKPRRTKWRNVKTRLSSWLFARRRDIISSQEHAEGVLQSCRYASGEAASYGWRGWRRRWPQSVSEAFRFLFPFARAQRIRHATSSWGHVTSTVS